MGALATFQIAHFRANILQTSFLHLPINQQTATMDSADAIPESVWNAVDQVSRVPKWMWAAGAVTGLFGIIVLVFPFSAIS